MALKNISPSSNFSSFRIREIGLERKSEVVELPNLQCIFDGNILPVHTSLESIVLGAVPCHVFARGIREFVQIQENNASSEPTSS